jgi:hypothetical protein
MNFTEELDYIENSLEPHGYHLIYQEGHCRSLGMAEFSNGNKFLVVTQKSGVWDLEGPRSLLEPFQLWKPYENIRQFSAALCTFINKDCKI